MLPSCRRSVVVVSGLLLGAFSLCAQNVISAKSGLIHYVEGEAWIGDKPVEVKPAMFPDLKENETLRTGEGRAEVLLNPGAFLRLGERSSIRMVTNRLIDTRLEFVSGSAVVETDDIFGEKNGSNLTIVYNDTTIALRKNGIYRFDSQPAALSVYSGEAEVRTAANSLVVKGSRRVALDGVSLVAEKFDASAGDSLTRWSKRRAEYLAMANVSGAKYVRDNSVSWARSGWFFNPYYGMFTYIPYSGVYMSPYGYRFYAPSVVYRVYERPVMASSGWNHPTYNSSYGYNTIGQTSSGYSGVVARSAGVGSVAAPSTTAAAAPSAPVARGSGSAGGRSR